MMLKNDNRTISLLTRPKKYFFHVKTKAQYPPTNILFSQPKEGKINVDREAYKGVCALESFPPH